MTNETILAAFAAAGHEYIEIEDLAETTDTLDQFRDAAKGWNECKSIDVEEYDGFASLEFDGVQVRKGDKRTALTVIDFGDRRFAYRP